MAISKEILIQYSDLQQECKEVREKIEKLERQIKKIESAVSIVSAVCAAIMTATHSPIATIPAQSAAPVKWAAYAA